MDGDDVGKIVEIAMPPVLAVIGWFIKVHHDRLHRIEQDAITHKSQLSEFMLEAERRFAKDASLQLSFQRVHERLDEIMKLLMKHIGSQ